MAYRAQGLHNTSRNKTQNVHWSVQQVYNKSWNVQHEIHLDG